MPECLAAGNERRAREWMLAVENLGEGWRCTWAQDAHTARVMMEERYYDAALLCPGEEGVKLAQLLRQRPPVAPPWVIALEESAAADGCIRRAEELEGLMADWTRCGRLPQLAQERHGQLLCLARGLMCALDVPGRLKAWDFLPDMAALCTVHPPLGEDLRGRLYPLLGRRHALTGAAVERRLRLAVESTWNHSSLAALERFFGHSVDPERGKPTNREFICRVQERLTLAARRIA
ncbi:MAG: hypothetical protein IJ507_00260 [Clostridia bacterium]|nr:hypothetical protein [Clostridia bacterium]